MLTLSLYLSTILTLLPPGLSSTTTPTTPYTPTDYFLLDCGSSAASTSPDGRHWDDDSHSKLSPPNIQTTSSPSTASKQDPSIPQVPYMTARIFHSNSTYSFPVSPGPKFLRLYFYPAMYSTHDKTDFFFSVITNGFTLLSNFSAFLSIIPPESTLVKEFIINVQNTQNLDVAFLPSPSSYAFINGIEVVSMPNDHYTSHRENVVIPFVGYNSYYDFDNTTTLETMYRLNVGGKQVCSVEDSGMFRTWSEDEVYMFGHVGGTTPYLRKVKIEYTVDTPAYTAPEIVYNTSRTMGSNPNVNLNYNLTWIFPVDAGFKYLVRLHFCETQLEVKRVNERVFYIFINNQTAEKAADVIQWSGGNGVPVYRDFVVFVQKEREACKVDLWLALHPNIKLQTKPDLADAILNGVEILKLNQSDGSLAGLNPEPAVSPTSPELYIKSPKQKKNNRLSLRMVVIGGVVGGGLAIISICYLYFLLCWRKRRVKESGTKEVKSVWVRFSKKWGSTNAFASLPPSDFFRYFSLDEINVATSNFDHRLVIGSGGFGNVYKGHINDGSTTVAIKRLNPSSKQGAREFRTEIDMLSKLRHVHLVVLIGYCDDQDEMILVYEYMAGGTLRDHLYKSKNPPLTWKQRLEICIGAARGLNYLHTGAKHMIIHRDVKSTNILLDDKWVAKISDFGLSKVGPTSVSQTHVSTVVKGSFGYVDPEYILRKQLTKKSDVYSFGVVLFEVLCSRPAMIPTLPKDQVNLAQWARKWYQSGTLDQIIDPSLRGKIAPECLKKFGEIADRCVCIQGIKRPTISDVVWGLEYALQLQENNINYSDGFNVGHIGLYTSGAQASPSNPRGEVTATDFDDLFSGSGGHVLDSGSTLTFGTSRASVGKRSAIDDV